MYTDVHLMVYYQPLFLVSDLADSDVGRNTEGGACCFFIMSQFVFALVKITGQEMNYRQFIGSSTILDYCLIDQIFSYTTFF